MKRTLNWTGRSKILERDLNLSLSETDHELRLAGTVKLPAVEEDAALIIELYREVERHRYHLDAGTNVAVDARFVRFAAAEAVKLDIKLVDRATGRLLAATRGQRPNLAVPEPALRRGLLEFIPRDLKEVLWQVAMENEEPVVLVNNRLDDWRAFVRTREFTAIAMPEICRAICMWLWPRLEAARSGEDETAARWERVFRISYGVDPAPFQSASGEDAAAEWIEATVNAFSRQHSFTTTWISRATEQED